MGVTFARTGFRTGSGEESRVRSMTIGFLSTCRVGDIVARVVYLDISWR